MGAEFGARGVGLAGRRGVVALPAEVLLRVYAPDAVTTPLALHSVYAALVGEAPFRRGEARKAYTSVQLGLICAVLHILCVCGGVGTYSSKV
jgi:hypothetical protein